ncbi:MAG TPA: DUF4424 family protein [Devosia sp.]|jgi:hypothetical protein|uniref:DUF4424 family protein n=1 Tax=Devosia sp. TaxID=1871048 RepID=UPI002DDD3324|nr:DUF4424 family protein [Devosia sp.]HEV2518568.1 DUF4424 family protein [Devosia sp.]
MLVRNALFIVFASLSAPALANGVISEFPAGGVVFKQAANIAIAREDLYLSVREVRVRYEYRSDAAATETHTIGFPMPTVPLDGGPSYLGGGSIEQLIDPRNYMDFAVKVNGKPITAKLHEFAQLDGKDITAELEAAGLAPLMLAEQFDASRFDRKTLEGFVAKGWFASAPESAEELWWPNWSYQTVYEWEQAFAPGETVVEISYAPLNGYPSDYGQVYEGGGEYDDPETVAAIRAEYCIDDAVLNAVQRQKAQGGYEVVTQGYVLTTGNFWKGPIEEFNLVVDKADPAEGMKNLDLVAFCPLEAKKISDTQFAWHASNFEPDRDMRVLYYSFYDFEQ